MHSVHKCRNSIKTSIKLPIDFLNQPGSELPLSVCLKKVDCAPYDDNAIEFENVNIMAFKLARSHCKLLPHLNNSESGQLEAQTDSNDILLLQEDTESQIPFDLSTINVKLVRTNSDLWQTLVLPRFSSGTEFTLALTLSIEIWLKRCECCIAEENEQQ